MSVAALLLATAGVVAENVVFPADAGVVDVKARFGARGDGVTDDTGAIQRAIDATKGIPDTLYFPDGTYLISDSVGIFHGKAHSRDRFLSLQGQSEARTVIRLKDRSPGFDDAARPKIALSLYEGQGSGDVMHSYARNLTVDVGRGNPGAVGLRFMSNNSGAVDHVTVRSSDPGRAGAIGLDMRQGQNGPCLVTHVTVDGFDRGVETGDTFSLVFEHLTLTRQNVVGFLNGSGRVTLRALRSVNRVPAVRNHRDQMTLIDADLTGGAPEQTAIVDETHKLFVREVRQRGYGHLLADASGGFRDGPALDEWHDGKGQSLFPGPVISLRLPVVETPDVPWPDDLAQWVKVPWTKPGEDVSAALQDAIDRAARAGRTTIYIPRHPGTYEYPRLSRPIRVHGSVNRVVGMSNIVDVSDPAGRLAAGEAILTFDDVRAPAVVVERFFLLGGWKGPAGAFAFDNRSGKALVLRNLGTSGKLKKPATGGRCFIEDVPVPGLHVGPGESCWARQYDPEAPRDDMIVVDGGALWILGLKTEGRARHVVARNHARVELLGGVSYQSWVKQPLDPPMFTVVDSDASFTLGFYSWTQPFTTIVEETRAGETRALARTALERGHLPIYRTGDAPSR